MPNDIRLEKLYEILRKYNQIIVAFSGGVDSSFLLYSAAQAIGPENVIAITAISPLLFKSEIDQAKEFVQKLGVRSITFDCDPLTIQEVAENSVQRCYFCKSGIFGHIARLAEDMKIPAVADGANADDQKDFRPGAKASKELGVISPLAEAGLTKKDIREFSRQAGLAIWNKPSMACLASRFPYGTRLTEKLIDRIRSFEESIFGLGFSEVRVRYHGDMARIEISTHDIDRMIQEPIRKKIVQIGKQLGFAYVSLDLQGYRTGSMNEVVDCTCQNQAISKNT